MKLVVDTNRLIAALVRDSYSRRILFSPHFDFWSLSVTRQDIAKYQSYLMAKTKLDFEQFDALIELIFTHVSILEDSALLPFMPNARAVMDAVDPDDTPFLAAAEAIRADGIWTDDPHFDKQNLVRVFNTKHLVPLL